MKLFGTRCFIGVVSKLKDTAGPHATSPAVLVLLQALFLHLPELHGLPVEYGAEEGEEEGKEHLCLILIYSKEMGGINLWIQELGSCGGCFSLNVAQSEKEEPRSVLHVVRTSSFEDQHQSRPPHSPVKIPGHSVRKIRFLALLRRVLNSQAGSLCRDADATLNKTTQAVRLWCHINLNKDILQVQLKIKPIARAHVGGDDYAVATLFNISSRLWLTTSSWVH